MAMDLSVLVGFTGYTSMMLNASKASRANANVAAGTGAATTGTIPTPWDTVNIKSETEAYRLAMQTTDYVNAKDSTFNKAGVPEDHKKLFALYKALSTLQTLTDKAANSKTEQGLLGGLDRRFQAGFAEVMDYARGLTFDHLTMVAGAKNTKAETVASVSRSTSNFTTRALVKGDVQTAMAQLENAGPFTISVARGASTINVPIDLDGMGSTPRNLGNVVNYVNAQLGAAGVQTRLKRVELPAPAVVKANQPTPTKQYAITIEGFASEQLSFAATAPSPALYLASQGVNAGELRKLDLSGSEPQTVYRTSIETGGDLNIRRTERDAEGNVFVLGTTSGNTGGQINQSARDVMLNKYDSAGNLLWSKLMGATDKVDGLALAIDSKGAAVVAGQLTGKIGTTPSAGGLDSYVMKITGAGEEVFVRQVGSALDDGATALTVGPDDAIYVGGTVKGRMLGAAGSIGGADAYVMKFSDKGVRAWTRQFGSAGDDKVAAMTIDDSGDLIVASEDGGEAVLRKFSTADATSPAVWSQSLGALGTGGAIGGIAVSAGRIYVAGGTANAALNGGANIVTAHSGGQDGFMAAMTDQGSSVAVDTVSYLGSGSADRINGIAVADGRIFLAGDTRGTLPGATATLAGAASNAFAAEMASDGTLQWARQFGVSTGVGYGRDLSVDAAGSSSVLDALGLPTGKLSSGMTRSITAQTTARVGDYFEIKVGDNIARRITIAAGETMTTLARKINSVLVLDGKATVTRTSAGERLRIEPREGQVIELKAGVKGLDALTGLGLAAGPVRKEGTTGETDPDALPAFALGFKASYSLSTTTSAAATKLVIDSAMAEIRKAYREITMDDETRKALNGDGAATKGKTGGKVPAYLTAQLANYNAGLARLTGGS